MAALLVAAAYYRIAGSPVRAGRTSVVHRFLLAPFYYQLLDQLPDGRDADFALRRHDEY